MQFLYFFPGRDKVSQEDLISEGLGYCFRTESATQTTTVFTPRTIVGGPDRHSGVVVSYGEAERIGYYADQQTWRKEPGKNYYVGMFNDAQPTPEDLRRDTVLDGTWLRLSDGNDWLLPKSREFVLVGDDVISSGCLFPKRLTRDESGDWIPGAVKQRYAELWRLSQAYVGALLEGDEDGTGQVRFQFGDYDHLVMLCFQANYRVSAAEIDLLGVFEEEMRDRVVRVLLDMDSYVALQKKTGPDSGNSSSGPNESTPESTTHDATNTTDQP